MLALIPNYIPLEVLIGFGIGALGGCVGLFIFPLRLHQYDSMIVDTLAFIVSVLILLSPVYFPLTIFLAMPLAFLCIWFVLPLVFLRAKNKPTKIKKNHEIETIIDTLSVEGRVAILEEMGILPQA